MQKVLGASLDRDGFYRSIHRFGLAREQEGADQIKRRHACDRCGGHIDPFLLAVAIHPRSAKQRQVHRITRDPATKPTRSAAVARECRCRS